MATLTSSGVAATVQARSGLDITSVVKSYTIAAGFATGDVIQMVKIPENATVLEVILSSSAGVGTTANLSVGDGLDADRYITSTAYTAAALTRLNAHTGVGYKYTAEDTIDVTGVSIATPTVGTVITLAVLYTLQTV